VNEEDWIIYTNTAHWFTVIFVQYFYLKTLDFSSKICYTMIVSERHEEKQKWGK
jgi:hypothetical protein